MSTDDWAALRLKELTKELITVGLNNMEPDDVLTLIKLQAEHIKELERKVNSDYILEQLEKWLKWQTAAEDSMGKDFRAIEAASGRPPINSNGSFQRSVAYQKTLTEIKRLRQQAD